jgi:hypothetical protein
LITSVVYSYDFVSRLSLGTIRDLKRVSEWLMYAVDEPEEKCNNIVSKAFRIKAGGVGMTDEQKQMESDWVGWGVTCRRGFLQTPVVLTGRRLVSVSLASENPGS